MLLVGASVLLVMVLLIAWRRAAFHRVRLGRKRLRTAPAGQLLGASARSASPTAPDMLPPPERPAEPSARAFPIQGLPSSPDRVAALQDALRRLAGVTQAYVSPVTALAYVTYVPTAVTPVQLADTIRHAGYSVPDETGWFDWHNRSQRHG